MARRVIVSGGSRGIGRATAVRLAKDGYQVAVGYVSGQSAAEETLLEIEQAGGVASLMQFDIANRLQTKEVLAKYLSDEGVPYGVVCNAGIASDSPFPIMEDEMWDKVIHTNLDGFYNVLKPLVMPMVSAHNGGRIIALSSISALAGNRGQVNYSASKAGIVAAARSLSLELAKRKITVNTVAPGIIDTEMVQDLPKKEVVRLIPMRRYGTSQEVAGVISFLMSDDASYVTGQVISVNGGMH